MIRRPPRSPLFPYTPLSRSPPGKRGAFSPAQPGTPPVAAVGRQACPFRRDPGPPGDQEVADLVPVVHGHDATPAFSRGGRVWHYLTDSKWNASSPAGL